VNAKEVEFQTYVSAMRKAKRIEESKTHEFNAALGEAESALRKLKPKSPILPNRSQK